MDSIRKWLYKPKRDDKSLLAQFFYADEDLNMVANELDSFDGRKDPERCTTLVNQLRQSQDKVLTITNAIMDVLIGDERANRDFRVKFPEDVLQENLAGQLWFGAECLAAGSSIMNREAESTAMRPLAKAVTKSLENVRNLLRDACLRNNTPNGPIKLDSNELVTEMLLESLKIFDRLFAEFELAYVSAMVPVKSTQEYELQELIGVLFSETLQRALKMGLLTQEMVDDCDPALMFTIPRLAIVSGLLIFPNGPLCIDKSVEEMSEMFRPFRTLLHKIRKLLWTLSNRELYQLEKLLCDNEQITSISKMNYELSETNGQFDNFINQFYNDHPLSKEYFASFSPNTCTENPPPSSKDEINYESLSNNINIPSTSSLANSSGYLITNSIAQNAIEGVMGTVRDLPEISERIESPPDRDSLEIISVAAATLSSILNDNNTEGNNNNNRDNNLESPNDSGICTETTSLDRSPSFDVNCNCTKPCSCSKQLNKLMPKTAIVRKRNKLLMKQQQMQQQQQMDDDSSSSSSSSETSSVNSNCVDDGEIALAMQAAEIASRNEVRSRFRSSEDLLHRLFVCIAGVADQLQTNFACDLRNILKSVFLMNASDSIESSQKVLDSPSPSLETSIEYHPSEEDVIENNEFSVDPNILAQEALFDTNVYFHLDGENCPPGGDYTNHPHSQNDNVERLSSDFSRYASLREDVANLSSLDVANSTLNSAEVSNESRVLERPPIWIPDVEAPKCMSCSANFTVVKRRHHCRNCGKVFCARCSSNSVPLPKFGHVKPVRVCNKCFLYNLAPFTM